jgi:hypothetical protein
MTKIVERLKHQSGHQTEGMILTAIFMVLIAIAVPQFMTARKSVKTLVCLGDLARAAGGEIDAAEAVCPLNDQPVRVERVDGGERFSLADLEDRFPSSPAFIRTQEGLSFEQRFPASDEATEGAGVVEVDFAERIRVRSTGSGFVLRKEKTVLGGISLVVVVLLLSLFIWGAFSEGGGCLLGLLVLVPALVLVVRGGIPTREISILPGEGSARIQTTWLWKFEGQPEIVGRPVALIPLTHSKQRQWVVLLHGGDRGLRTRKLFALDADQVAGLSFIEAELERARRLLDSGISDTAR